MRCNRCGANEVQSPCPYSDVPCEGRMTLPDEAWEDNNPRPRHEQLADLLRIEVLTGDYEPGEQFPTLRWIQGRYGVSQTTAQRAERILQDEGLLVVRRRVGSQRAGTFVGAGQLPPVRRPNRGVDNGDNDHEYLLHLTLYRDGTIYLDAPRMQPGELGNVLRTLADAADNGALHLAEHDPNGNPNRGQEQR